MPEQAANCAQKPDRVGQMAGRMFALGSRTKRVIASAGAGRFGFKICKRHLNTVPIRACLLERLGLGPIACTSVYLRAQSRCWAMSRQYSESTASSPITVWMEVRVLPAPPRSPMRTDVSRSLTNSPQFAGVSAVQMRDLRSLPPAEVAIASILAAGLSALQTRSWRQPELHMKTARIKSTNRASRITRCAN